MDVFRGFLTALDEAILPSVSLLSCNCGVSEEVWSMLKQLPYERRYIHTPFSFILHHFCGWEELLLMAHTLPK